MTGFRLIPQIFAQAEARLSPQIHDYLAGGAGREETLRRNRTALEGIRFLPRVLRDVSRVEARTTFLGQSLRIPVFLSPVGSLGCFHPDGVCGSARAAARFGTLLFCGINAEVSLDEVVCHSDRPLGLQLYTYGDLDWAAAIVERAERLGFMAICLTVDVPAPGWRERDIANDHKILASLSRPNLPEGIRRTGGHPGRTSWEDLAFLRARTDLPIIVKGIQSPEDARLAADAGAAAVYLSNHGGRQLDSCPSTIELLPGIRQSIGNDLPLLIDSGFRHGTDVVKALALGADAVGVGRLHAAALAANGEAGVGSMLEIMEAEILNTLAQLGVAKLADLGAVVLHSAPH
ncbi:alpha-hydroxy-acid oxidizing protein [Sinirhodobacter populi]|uniref:Alpha-hydroxy-acid oxidizing protein n=1 Tax=Paenirhodobacter populi TaxID=2306993 RepID=A0A443K4L1_9RHOB|nr:alpha-hydroxy acid oxidase [Sinirhodobacter populi]RWR27709.1 alpha-hydroxy-acid oxidizing protein [Sinirhodobacter populi]